MKPVEKIKGWFQGLLQNYQDSKKPWVSPQTPDQIAEAKLKAGGYYKGEDGVYRIASPSPSTAPSQGQVLGSSPQRLAVEKYQGKSNTPIPPVPQDLTDLLFQYDSQDATRSGMRIAGENGSYKYNPAPNLNNNGTYDYGLGQINTTTWNDMFKKKKYRNMLDNYGIKSIDDASKSLEKGVQAYMVAKQYEADSNAPPASWWYGWQDKGYNIDPSRPIDEVAKTPAYKNLRKFLKNNPDRVEVGR